MARDGTTTAEGVERVVDPHPINGSGLTGGVGLVNGTGLTNALGPYMDRIPSPKEMTRTKGFTNGGGRVVAPPLSASTDQINGLVTRPGVHSVDRAGSWTLPWSRWRSRRRLEVMASMPLPGAGDAPADPAMLG